MDCHAALAMTNQDLDCHAALAMTNQDLDRRATLAMTDTPHLVIARPKAVAIHGGTGRGTWIATLRSQ